MGDCVICDIVGGVIPSDIVYDDADVVAFLPLTMDAYGHTVIAPKVHHADLRTAPDAVVAQVMACVKRLASQYERCVGSTGFNLLHASGASAQQSVPHLHVHLLPRYDSDGLNAWPAFPVTPYDKAEFMKRALLRTSD